MKISKTLKWFSIVIGILIAAFIVFNQYDLSEPVILFTEKDLRPVVKQDSENGYFIILGLLEKAGVDPLSTETTKKYRKMVKESIDRLKNRSDNYKGDQTADAKWDINNAIFSEGNFINQSLKHRKLVEEQLLKNRVLFERFDKLLTMDHIEDIWAPILTYRSLHFQATMKIQQLYMANKISYVSETGWDSLLNSFVLTFQVGKKVAASGRMLITSLSGYSMQDISLRAWSHALDWDQLPPAMLDASISKLESLRNEIPSSKNALIGDYLMSHWIIMNIDKLEFQKMYMLMSIYEGLADLLADLTFQRNRTTSYLAELCTEVFERHKAPPYKRGAYKYKRKADQPFWWLQNYGGKMLEAVAVVNYEYFITKEYETRAMLELTLLSAMLHKKKIKPEHVREWLEEKFKEGYVDPFTGRAYIWNPKSRFITVGKELREHQVNTTKVPYLKKEWPKPKPRKSRKKRRKRK